MFGGLRCEAAAERRSRWGIKGEWHSEPVRARVASDGLQHTGAHKILEEHTQVVGKGGRRLCSERRRYGPGLIVRVRLTLCPGRAGVGPDTARLCSMTVVPGGLSKQRQVPTNSDSCMAGGLVLGSHSPLASDVL